MRTTHRFEFWPYLQGLEPRDIHVDQENILYCLERENEFPEIPRGTLSISLDLAKKIEEEVEQTWAEGKAVNSGLKNNLKPNLQRISPDGKTLQTAFATYKTSFWIKKKLSTYPFDIQRSLADQFPFANIGIVTVTADDRILIERRPTGVTAGGMLLNYPCGYLSRGETTLEATINCQAIGELGFPITGLEAREGVLTEVRSLGVQRESDEWTPNYTFLMHLNIAYKDIKPTKETKDIVSFPAQAPALCDEIAKFYSPTIKGDREGRLVPNATGMFALYIRSVFGEQMYRSLLDRLVETAKLQGNRLEVTEYTSTTNPFR